MMCPSPEALGPGSRRVPRRRYADPPAGALLTGLQDGRRSRVRLKGGAPATALLVDRLARSILSTLIQMLNRASPAELTPCNRTVMSGKTKIGSVDSPMVSPDAAAFVSLR